MSRTDKEATVPESRVHRSYLIDNNPELDIMALERRLEEILVERRAPPDSPRPLPSLQPAVRPSVLRRLLIRIKGSYLVTRWLPRHPALYRRARALYHWLRGMAGRH